MNPMAEKMIREAFEKENSPWNFLRSADRPEEYENIVVQNRWMGWQQATEFWIQEHAPIAIKRRGSK